MVCVMMKKAMNKKFDEIDPKNIDPKNIESAIKLILKTIVETGKINEKYNPDEIKKMISQLEEKTKLNKNELKIVESLMVVDPKKANELAKNIEDLKKAEENSQ